MAMRNDTMLKQEIFQKNTVDQNVRVLTEGKRTRERCRPGQSHVARSGRLPRWAAPLGALGVMPSGLQEKRKAVIFRGALKYLDQA